MEFSGMGAVSNCNRYACLGVFGSVQSGQADQKDDCGRDDKPGVDFTFFSKITRGL